MSDVRFERALQLAARREEAGNREAAMRLLEEMVADGSAAPSARFLLASLYDDHPDGLPEAIIHYRAGLVTEPGDSAARNNLAVACMALGRREEAVDTLAAVVVEDPGYGLAAQNLAVALEHLDDAALAALLMRLSRDGSGGALARLVRAVADAGRQEAFASTYAAGHALKNLVGLSGSKAQALARKVPDEPGAKELAATLEKVYGDWASFLKTARSEAQRREACDLNTLAREVARGFAEDDAPCLALATGTPLAIGDPAALREALLNLTRNAREASPHGRVELATAVDPGGRWVRVLVTDDGPGVSPENVKRIFAPGFTTKPQGSGFGLAIAERIVRAEGGRIEVESVPGHGARFSLVLPAATATPPRIAPRLAPEEFTRPLGPGSR